jgi:GNAT superfamily N-acetyltransferase
LEIETLNWDSGFFGIKIGRINIDSSFNSAEFRSIAEKGNFDLIYVFLESKYFQHDLVMHSDFSLIDVMVTMSLELPDTVDHTLFDFNSALSKNEVDECYEIAENIAKVSRFYREPCIGVEKSIRLYKKWIDNSLNGSFCDGILLNRSDGHIRGIHIIKTDMAERIGYCSLIGTHPLYKAKGIGRNLWQQAFSYWRTKRTVDRCMVTFSLENLESFNFHLKIGFDKVESVRFVYHYRKK